MVVCWGVISVPGVPALTRKENYLSGGRWSSFILCVSRYIRSEVSLGADIQRNVWWLVLAQTCAPASLSLFDFKRTFIWDSVLLTTPADIE